MQFLSKDGLQYFFSCIKKKFLPLAGGTMTGQIVRDGKGGSWYAGRSLAPIRTTTNTTSSAFFSGLSIKTPSGTWDVGVLGETLYFVYCLDSNFNSGTNTTSNYSIDTSGFYSGAVSKKNTATLAVASWSGSGPYTQTVSVSGVTASNTVVVAPAPASFTAWGECGVYASAQASGKLTFTAAVKPTAALTAQVLCFNSI